MIFQVVEAIAKAAVKEAVKEGVKTGAKVIAKEGLKKGIKAGVKAGIEKGGKVILEKGEKAISKAAKKLKGDWISDITGKIYRNTTRAKAEQYEKASERMRKDPSKYAGWTKEGREKADRGEEITKPQTIADLPADWLEQMAQYDVDAGESEETEIGDFSKIPDYIDYDDLPQELKDLLHNEDKKTDDPEKAALVEGLSDEGWNGIDIKTMKEEISLSGNLQLLTRLTKFY